MIYTNDYESPLGNILLAGDEQGLTGLWFTEGGRYTGLGLKKGASRRETDYFDQTKKWLDIYFAGHDPGFFPTNWQKSAGSKGCPLRQLVVLSVIIRSALSYRATEWSELMGT